WVESLTALVETHAGEWQLIDYTTFDLQKELTDIIWADSSLPSKAKVAGI
ncbi:MAG: hypothetical protein RIQ98_38, partial [Bacteroidota bacterium]